MKRPSSIFIVGRMSDFSACNSNFRNWYRTYRKLERYKRIKCLNLRIIFSIKKGRTFPSQSYFLKYPNFNVLATPLTC